MPESLMKTNAYLAKNVDGYSLPLSKEVINQLDQLFNNYGRCRGMFYNELCGINNLINVRNFRKIRNKVRKKGFNKVLMKRYGFLSRHWTYALFETCSNISSIWTNLANRLRKVIQSHDGLTEEERHWLFFVLKHDDIWQDILKFDTKFYLKLNKKTQKAYFKVADQLSDRQIKRLSSYLRRIARRYKPKPHKVNPHNKSMEYDDSMYRFTGTRTINVSSSVARKPITLTLTSDWHYKTTGNIKLILDRDKERVEIHKQINSHTSTRYWGTVPRGADKGLYTLISSSSGKEYGRGFSALSNKQADILAKKNAERNKHCDSITHKVSGSKHYNKMCNRYKERMKAKINQAVLQFLKGEKPNILVKEDLTWTKDKLPKVHNKYIARSRRRLNSWTKGYLDERLEYYCAKFNIPIQNINPAYTSQYCPYCGHKFDKRVGNHHEWVHCVNCGWLPANTTAAKSILKRKDDPEISLYTPYRQVKKILDSRI